MEKIIYLISAILLSGLVSVNSLQCYVCFNCTDPTDADLQTCGAPIITTEAPTSTTQAAATTTEAPPTTTQGPPTTTQAPPATTQAPPTTTQGPPTTTQDPPNTTQDPPTTTQAPPTTTAVPTTTTQAATTTPEAPTTTPQAPTTTTVAGQDTTTLEPENPPPGRPKRNAPAFDSITDYVRCPCRSEPGCPCDIAFSKGISQYVDEDVPFVCYKFTADWNSETVIGRGCSPATVNGTSICDLESTKNETTSCRTCSSDKCNGSYAVQYSTVSLVAAIGMLFFK